jgi:GNAT superfamily N-acetyltransferase
MPWLPRLHTDDETAAWMAGDVLARCTVWVAAVPGTPPGQAPAVAFAAVLGDELEHLYVQPAPQGRGVGTDLLARALRACPDGLTLRVFTRNTAARGFYERHGFTVVDTDDGSRNEEGGPDLTYRSPTPPSRGPRPSSRAGD